MEYRDTLLLLFMSQILVLINAYPILDSVIAVLLFLVNLLSEPKTRRKSLRGADPSYTNLHAYQPMKRES